MPQQPDPAKTLAPKEPAWQYVEGCASTRKCSEKCGYTEECEGCRLRITKALGGDEEHLDKIRRETERIARQVQAQVEEKKQRGNDISNQPDRDKDQCDQSSPEDEEMPDASGVGMTEQAEGAEGDIEHTRHELGENEIEGEDVQRRRSEGDHRWIRWASRSTS